MSVDLFLKAVQASKSVDNCPGKYFASLAKISHFWRQNVGKFIELWEKIHGFTSDTHQYRRFPLTVCGGRWGSVDTMEAFLLQRGRKRLVPVLVAMLSSAMKAEPKKKTAESAGQCETQHDQSELIEDLQDQVDDSAAYKLKMSKYTSGALEAVNSDLFWCLVRLMYTIRGPLRRFFLWSQKHSQNRPMLHLVCGMADQIKHDFDQLYLTLDTWFSDALVEAGANLPTGLSTLLRTLCAKLVVSACGGFELRIRSLTKK